jgi:TolB-like protein
MKRFWETLFHGSSQTRNDSNHPFSLTDRPELNMSHRFFSFLFSLVPIFAAAQTSVAVGDFENRTDHFYLDSWTQKIPDYLSTDLSRFTDLVVVNRQQLKSVLDEQRLQLTGLTDSSAVQEIGQQLSAQYLVTGAINESDGWIRIDARVTSVSTGRMIAEKVQARSRDYLEKMITLLANNLAFQLTGRGEYRESMIARKRPTSYLLGAALIAGGASAILNQSYQNRLNRYHQATSLVDFNPTYNSANRYYRARNVALAATGAAFLITVYSWIQDLSPERILANPKPVLPSLHIQQGEITVGLRLDF